MIHLDLRPSVGEMQPPFDLPAGVIFDGVQDFLGRKLLMFTLVDVPGQETTISLRPERASAAALAEAVAAKRAEYTKGAA